MLPKINPSGTNAWKELKAHAAIMSKAQLRDLFQQDDRRFEQFHLQFGDILFDYSKNIITQDTINLLLKLANECQLKDAIDSMFNGELINETERRSVLHTALRNFSKGPVYAEGQDVMPMVKKVQKKMKAFCDVIHSGKQRGYSGKKIRCIVNIGIGGSDLGPLMVTEALKPYQLEGIETYFVSNVDGNSYR